MSVNPDPRCSPCHDGCGCVQDEIARLEAENAELTRNLSGVTEECSNLLQIKAGLEAERDALRLLLKPAEKWQHSPDCPSALLRYSDCECGLYAARKVGEEPR